MGATCASFFFWFAAFFFLMLIGFCVVHQSSSVLHLCQQFKLSVALEREQVISVGAGKTANTSAGIAEATDLSANPETNGWSTTP